MFTASAPTRIDFAGGTVDIWPVYLLTTGAVTVNAGIDLRAEAVVRPRSDGLLVARSHDQNARMRRPVARPVRRGEPLELLARLGREFGPPGGATLETRCAAPAGSGLGGSSALAIAVASALAALSGRAIPRTRRLALVRDLETQVLGIPAGEQDYYGALWGGLQAIEWGPGGGVRRALDADLDALRARSVLCFSGASRSSGDSNWDMVKRRLDGNAANARAFAGVVGAARAMERALTASDWKGAGEALREEMHHRERLSPRVAGGPIESLLRAGTRAGAWGGKVCGAGGGGCLVFLAPPARVLDVEAALTSHGARVLEFQFARGGVTVASKAMSRAV